MLNAGNLLCRRGSPGLARARRGVLRTHSQEAYLNPPEDSEVPTFQSFGVNILNPITAFPSPLKNVLVAEVTGLGTGTG